MGFRVLGFGALEFRGVGVYRCRGVGGVGFRVWDLGSRVSGVGFDIGEESVEDRLVRDHAQLPRVLEHKRLHGGQSE